jgi:hypothetical protein
VGDDNQAETLEAREPSVEDLVDLCRRLNSWQARYVVIGGFAIRAAGCAGVDRTGNRARSFCVENPSNSDLVAHRLSPTWTPPSVPRPWPSGTTSPGGNNR